MQVAQQETHITHAVLGGKDNISFGISDDPAFFQILSSALYKNPKLAMVRETICNAWDAHIDSGRTDRPIEITLTHEKLVIRDFGKGIKHDLIGPVYAVYGASTKKNDGRQTGGFGLGCKSPFAYTDHFEVISFHDGKKTIYNMSKSSAEKAGKPGVVTIATFPTDETGIQITIPLRGDSGDDELRSMIRQVLFNGDIKANLDGVQYPTLGLDNAPHGFMLINDRCMDNQLPTGHLQGQHRIFVRYGNVIYPVEMATEITVLWGKVNNLLHKMYQCRLIMMAPPDSISITPSRESLTMSELSVDTLKTLMSAFLAHIFQNKELTQRHEEMVNEYIDKAATTEHISVADKVYVAEWRVPGVPYTYDTKILSTTDDFAIMETLLRYSGQGRDLPPKKWLSVMNRYLSRMGADGLLPRGLLSTWQDTARKIGKNLRDPSRNGYRHSYEHVDTTRWCDATGATDWWRKRVMLPMMKKVLGAHKSLKVGMLYYWDENMAGKESLRGIPQPKPLKGVTIRSHTRNLQFMMEPSLVLCHNAQIIKKRMTHDLALHRAGTNQFGTFFVLELERTKEVKEQVLPLLLAMQGVHIIDLTGRTSVEEHAYQERLDVAAHNRKVWAAANPSNPDKPKKKVASGLVRFDAMLDGANYINTTFMTKEDAARLTNPAYLELASTAEGSIRSTSSLDSIASVAFAKLYGALGSITNNRGVFDRHTKEKGVMSLNGFIVDKVVNDFGVNPELKAYMDFDDDKVKKYLEKSCCGYARAQNLAKLYSMMLHSNALHGLIPGFVALSEENQLKLVLWKQISNDYSWYKQEEVAEVKKKLNDAPLPDGIQKFLKELISNRFIDMLDVDDMQCFVTANRKDPASLAKALDILKLIIN